jgi:hypothetical protein
MHNNTILKLPARTPREDARPAAPATPRQQLAGHGDLWLTHRLRWCMSLVSDERPATRQPGD